MPTDVRGGAAERQYRHWLQQPASWTFWLTAAMPDGKLCGEPLILPEFPSRTAYQSSCRGGGGAGGRGAGGSASARGTVVHWCPSSPGKAEQWRGSSVSSSLSSSHRHHHHNRTMHHQRRQHCRCHALPAPLPSCHCHSAMGRVACAGWHKTIQRHENICGTATVVIGSSNRGSLTRLTRL